MAAQFSKQGMFLQEIADRLAATETPNLNNGGKVESKSGVEIEMKKHKKSSYGNSNSNLRVSPISRKYLLEILLQICI